MVLFRALSARERWVRHGPASGLWVALAVAFAAVFLVIDGLAGGPAYRVLSAARQEFSIAKCMEERRAHTAALGAARKSLRSACAAHLRAP